MHYINDNRGISGETALTIGSFDGFHRGHTRLIDKINEIKRVEGLKSLVFSFYPRPSSVFGFSNEKSIFVRNERVKLAEAFGVDILVEHSFTKDFSNMDGETFIRGILIERYNCRHIVIGEDFRFGKDRSWSASMLKNLSEIIGIKVHIISHENFGGEKISSTFIRENIESGSISKANKLLGHDYYIGGMAEFAAADAISPFDSMFRLMPAGDKLLPGNGVYITNTCLPGNKRYDSITFVTSGGTVGTKIKTYAIGMQNQAYGSIAKVVFKEFLRDEIKVLSNEVLSNQIKNDVKAMNEYYKSGILR